MSVIHIPNVQLSAWHGMHLQRGLDDSVVGGPVVSKDCSLVLLTTWPKIHMHTRTKPPGIPA